MEPNDTNPPQHHFSPYFTTSPPTSTATNGLPSPTPPAPSPAAPTTTTTPGSHHHHQQQRQQQQQQQHFLYPHPVVTPSVVSEPPKRKRGRPRKYVTAEQALAAKRSSASSNSANRAEKREQQPGSASHSNSSKKSSLQQLHGLGNVGQGFTPHVIYVGAGEDVIQKIMLFLQQSKREMCILSACGSISNVSLRQPATSGGNVAYEGRFEIITLSGSYVRTDAGGITGGLSVCLSNTGGQIIGGGVGGPLKAAGPVQVIVGTFSLDNKKDLSSAVKGDASASILPPSVGMVPISHVGFGPPVETSLRNPIRGSDDHLALGGNPFMLQARDMHQMSPRPTDWKSATDPRTNVGYELAGRPGQGTHQSPENGDYEQLSV